MSGELFIVATPIGNLDDITLRAIEILRRVELVAAEDTRHSQQLFNHLGFQQKMISLHEHNEHQRIQQILDILQQDQSIALISDAGTPLISDPGYPLVRAVVEAGFRVTPVPGASGIITALSAAGLPTDQFCFHGFLPSKGAERLLKIESLSHRSGTHVLYESTHRIELLLQQLDEIMPLGEVVVAKELTKRYENFIRGTASECLNKFEQEPALKKGEFVVLIHVSEIEEPQINKVDTEVLLTTLLAEFPLKKAVNLAVKITGDRKNKLYQTALAISQNKST